MRIGQGYDVHKLVEGRDLILGGVTVPYEKGLLGHSDADVLVHAVMDALLGAAALGDIGQHFPDTDPKYKGISSIALLKEVGALLEKEGYIIENIDATIIAQRPKLAAYRQQMAKNCSNCTEKQQKSRRFFSKSNEKISFYTLCTKSENFLWQFVPWSKNSVWCIIFYRLCERSYSLTR